ncbi:nuclear transport factor 2 family protein [Metallibacterium sp.]|uniref:nuclear transport factor 2 family protein n=1 Tax=Metallibacterium sp. TaxID=2940281 RepID=UPI002635F5F7|nr:nuclear transport factor 2 family protein [Metallibacterium sp.]
MLREIESQLHIVEERLRRAMLASDVETLDKLISPELLFTNHFGQVLGKQDDLAAHQSGILKFHTLEPSESQTRISEKMAIVSVRIKMSGVYDGKPFASHLRYTRVWCLSQNNALQVVAGHSSAIQE